MRNFARSFAKELASDPFVRETLFQFCWENATISSYPTKAGIKEICSDPTHPFFGVHRFVNKPVKSFSDVAADDSGAGDRQGVAFLDLINASKDRGGKEGKLVEYVINLDDSLLEVNDQVTLISSDTDFCSSAIPDHIHENEIKALFPAAELKRVDIVKDEAGKNVAFISFVNARAARASIKRELVLDGQALVILPAAGKRRGVIVDPDRKDGQCAVRWEGGGEEEYPRQLLAPCQSTKKLYEIVERAVMPSTTAILSDLQRLTNDGPSHENDPSMQPG